MQTINSLSYDIRKAAEHAILAAWSLSQRNEHPQAVDFFDEPLSKLARACAAVTPRRAYDTDDSIIARGLLTQDFGQILSNAATVFARDRYRNNATHLTFCQLVEVRNFRPHEFADGSVQTTLDPVSEHDEVTNGRVTFYSTNVAKLTRYAKILSFSDEVVTNDAIDLVKTALAGLGSAAASNEASAVYGVLEANGALSDAAPVFHPDFGNVVADPLSDTALASAMAKLRKGMSGHADDVDSDLNAHHLVVSASLEFAAKKLNIDAGLGLSITTTCRLPEGRWFLLPSQHVQPVVGILRLRGSAEPVSIDPHRRRSQEGGFAVKGSANIGAVMLTRHAIRGGA